MPNGDRLVLGTSNNATQVTFLDKYVGGIGIGLQVRNKSGASAVAIQGTANGYGIDGTGDTAGVLGSGPSVGVLGVSQDGTGVGGYSPNGRGVHGYSSNRNGVFGESVRNAGVGGRSAAGAGVHGFSDSGIGVFGSTGSQRSYAGVFWGRVFVAGDLFVAGQKSAAVPHPDGSHRLLFAVESPETWFEDFGVGKLSRGRASIKLARDFAAVARPTRYHVFLTPQGDCNGLYVHRIGRAGFEVREQRGGKSGVRFSYRIVAKRKDTPDRRLPKVQVPEAPNPVPLSTGSTLRAWRHAVHLRTSPRLRRRP